MQKWMRTVYPIHTYSLKHSSEMIVIQLHFKAYFFLLLSLLNNVTEYIKTIYL